jgi:hypothetical protein
MDSPFRYRGVGKGILSSRSAGKIPLKTKYVRAVPRSLSGIPNGQMRIGDKTLRSWSSRTLSGSHFSMETLTLVRLPSGRENLGAIADTYLPRRLRMIDSDNSYGWEEVMEIMQNNPLRPF